MKVTGELCVLLLGLFAFDTSVTLFSLSVGEKL